MALSGRAEDGLKMSNYMAGASCAYMANPYHPQTNPEGIINLGIAENTLCEDIIMERLNQTDMVQVETWQLNYSNWYGALSFRKALATFLTKYFNSATRIDASDLMVTAGGGGALEHIAFACADPGDCILIPSPVYPVMLDDIDYRMKVDWFPFPLSHEPDTPGEPHFQISQKLLEDTYEKALAKGEKVKAVLLSNPCNPTGTIFNRQSIENLLEFTRRHELHLIIDEIFGLSVHGEDAEFPSILSFPEALDSERVHMLWGVSKDLGISGLRVGVICTRNQRMMKSLRHPAYLGNVSSLSQGVVSRILMDHEWLDTVYFPTNLSRLRKAHKYVEEELRKRGIIPHPAEATFFIWADFRKGPINNIPALVKIMATARPGDKPLSQPMMYASTPEDEKTLVVELFKAGVYIVPGFGMHAPEPGWMRITKTTNMAYLKLAFERMDRVLGIKVS